MEFEDKSMVRVGIVGASGYTAIESIRWLLRHPKVEITAATSRQGDGSAIENMHPELTDRLALKVEDLSPRQIADRCDVAFSCLPHGASAHNVMELLDAGCRVIDLSADYRLSNPELYSKWYGETHPDPGRLGSTPYGLPELFESQLPEARLVANPGCYPTSAILPLAPLLKNDLIHANQIVVDSKSGVSGAGRTPKLGNLYVECNESISAYSVGNHRHQPEIIDILARYSGVTPELVFTPHLTPMERGILSTIYVRPKGNVSANQIRECISNAYAPCPFVRSVVHLPATRFVTHTNYCDIAVRENDGWVILISTIDNLVKGASGAAVQNLNYMFGFEPTLGLIP
jgi:N-acetyl-gamma-glutamyl-phosphate reductase